MRIFYEICIQRGIRQIGSEAVKEKYYHTAEKRFVFHRLAENIGKLYFCAGGFVFIFLRYAQKKRICHGEHIRNYSQICHHRELCG